MTDPKCKGCSQSSCTANVRRPGETEQQHGERLALRLQMCQIESKIVVLSGKGGVGKSTFAVNLAMSMALDGKRVGVLDVDVHGPSVPRLLGLDGRNIETRNGKMMPLGYEGLTVMSVGFLLANTDDPVIWRGPMKYGVIKQFLTDVEWGDLDTLVIDCPPGTGDEPLSVVQTYKKIDGSLIVSTPQDIALLDARKTIKFSQKLNVPVLGIIENMSTFVCPHCGEEIDIFQGYGVAKAAADFQIDILGKIPIDRKIVEAGDFGKSFMTENEDSPSVKEFDRIVQKVITKIEK